LNTFGYKTLEGTILNIPTYLEDNPNMKEMSEIPTTRVKNIKPFVRGAKTCDTLEISVVGP